jgi:hypothetical protein
MRYYSVNCYNQSFYLVPEKDILIILCLVADGGNGLQITANILNKQSRTAKKG